MDAPTPAEFRTFFARDFPALPDTDIQRALDEAEININPNLFSVQKRFSIAFMYLAAHNLVTNLQNSSQGHMGQGNWLQAAKSVGGVSESFVIPDRIQKSPVFASFSKTRYGMKYLEIIGPALIGQVFVVRGRTSP